MQVPWDEAMRACGHLMKPTDHLPLRYEVDGFPEAAVFDAWHAKAEAEKVQQGS